MIPSLWSVESTCVVCQTLPVSQCRELGKVNELFQVDVLQAVNKDKDKNKTININKDSLKVGFETSATNFLLAK